MRRIIKKTYRGETHYYPQFKFLLLWHFYSYVGADAHGEIEMLNHKFDTLEQAQEYLKLKDSVPVEEVVWEEKYFTKKEEM